MRNAIAILLLASAPAAFAEQSAWDRVSTYNESLGMMVKPYDRIKSALGDLVATSPEDWDYAVPEELAAQRDRCADGLAAADHMIEGLRSKRVIDVWLKERRARTMRIQALRWALESKKLLEDCEAAFNRRLAGEKSVDHGRDAAREVTEFSF